MTSQQPPTETISKDSQPCLVVTLLYTTKSMTRFDLQYYKEVHLPMVKRIWTKHGLLSCHVSTVVNSEVTGYHVQTVLTWNDRGAWEAATADEESKELFGDVVNYTDAECVVVVGEVLC